MIWFVLLYLIVGWALTRFLFYRVFDWTVPGPHDYAVDYGDIAMAMLFWPIHLTWLFVFGVFIPCIKLAVMVLFYKNRS